jgi:hypothetical protein
MGHQDKTTAILADLAEQFEALGSAAAPSGFGRRLYENRDTIAIALRVLRLVRYPSDSEAAEIGQLGGNPPSIRGFVVDGQVVFQAIIELAKSGEAA